MHLDHSSLKAQLPQPSLDCIASKSFHMRSPQERRQGEYFLASFNHKITLSGYMARIVYSALHAYCLHDVLSAHNCVPGQLALVVQQTGGGGGVVTAYATFDADKAKYAP